MTHKTNKQMSKLETCDHCGEEKENCFHGHIAMCIPIPELEAKKNNWGGKEWWRHLDRMDVTEEEYKELNGLVIYDQLLNTIGKGVQCQDCGKKEEELYQKYYPKSLES